jgi:hypothetical protein
MNKKDKHGKVQYNTKYAVQNTGKRIECSKLWNALCNGSVSSLAQCVRLQLTQCVRLQLVQCVRLQLSAVRPSSASAVRPSPA